MLLRAVALVVAAVLAVATAEGARGSKPSSLRSAPPRQLSFVTSRLGPTDPHELDLSALLPRRARLRQVWFVRGGRLADQVLVEWIRSGRVSVYSGDFPDTVEWGLTLWTQTPRRRFDYQAPWHAVALPLLQLAPGGPNLRVRIADVTSDGHPDVLIEQYPHTNHACGPHRVFATLAGGRTWRIFGAYMCETPLRAANGMLALELPRYGPHDSVCCWSKVEKLRLRWDGHRYVEASARVVRVRG